MKKILFLLFFTILFADSPFESPKSNSFDMSAYETKKSIENEEASQNPRIKCRWVCDKKIYTEQKIVEAISFYKNSKDYSFK